MRKLAMVLSMILLIPALLAAQQPKFEVGTRGGVTYITNDGNLLAVALPGAGAAPLGNTLLGNSVVHFGFFPSPNIMVEPQLGFQLLNVSNGDSETFSAVIIALQGMYMFNGVTTNSAYIGISGAFNLFDLGEFADSETDFAAGGMVGYRIVPLEFLALRFEAFYRRWFDFEINEFGGAIVLGVVIN